MPDKVADKDVVKASEVKLYQTFAQEIWSESEKQIVIELCVRVPWGFRPTDKCRSKGQFLPDNIMAVNKEGIFRKVPVGEMVTRLHGHLDIEVPDIQREIAPNRPPPVEIKPRYGEPASDMEWLEDLINKGQASKILEAAKTVEKQNIA